MCSTTWAREISRGWWKSSGALIARARGDPPSAPFARIAHIGIHAQNQDGLNWIGVAVPVGR